MDLGTGMYYLQSRYYDPTLGRFINADVFASTGQGLIGNNMFSYCGNNPVSRSDSAGNLWEKIVSAVCGIVSTCILKIYQNNLAAKNYAANSLKDSESSTTTKSRLIDDQSGATGDNYQYGRYSARWNACGPIAVHNAKILTGHESTLSETMADFQHAGAMIGDGFFGSDPYMIGNVLKSNNISYSMVSSKELTQTGTYIISYWLDGAPWEGLHTAAVFYDGSTYTTYNVINTDMINVDSASFAKRFICGYYLG